MFRSTRRHDRGVLVGAPRELFAEAGDQEQRVVDREPEAEADDEVQREDVQAVELVDAEQHEERAQDGGHADDQREQRRSAAEEEQRQQRQEREGEHLRAPEVFGDGLADLESGDRGTAPCSATGRATTATTTCSTT